MSFERQHLPALETINKLIIKAVSAPSRQSLAFIILNDTVELIRYDRATLWNIEEKRPRLIGISGQATLNQYAELQQKWNKLVVGLKDPFKSQMLTEESFLENKEIWKELQGANQSSVLWLPIKSDEKPVLGLWLEKWNVTEQVQPPATLLSLLNDHLLPGYGAAWSKQQRKRGFRGRFSLSKPVYLLALLGILSTFFIDIPLRVVAPCEIVAKNPTVVTAPLDGIIESVKVSPGQKVRSGELLVEYDKRIPLQELLVTRKQVEILRSEVDRAMTLGISDTRSLSELAILKLKLQKEELNLDLAEYKAKRLTVTAPVNGVAMLDDPDDWKGKPVKMGEKILTLSNPAQSKIKIWIPENDNIQLDPSRDIKIFLNIDPEHSLPAKLIYIANESSISEKGAPSFVAEAEWIKDGQTKSVDDQEIKLGLKGSAILYGEKVSLFYYIIRKPWAALRGTWGG